MQLEVLLFAAARDAAGSNMIRVELSEPATAGDVMDAIGQQLPQLAGLLPSCRLAIDCDYVPIETPVSDSCGEIALIPPVSGG
jgi:molybdopterin converting factor small subunit